jgi:NAD(P)-dependent dehydrogenase (short-subunit alcohol dehydrogenase family)
MSIAFDMSGKVAIVTGAASGLGRVTALKLAEAGADLCIVDRNAEDDTASMITGVEVLVRVTDLSLAANCAPVVADTVKRFGRLDALCNVAGIFQFHRSHEMPIEAWDKVIAINLTAPFLLSSAAIPHLLESGGAIVNCASTAAYVGEAYAAAYCATKAGVLQMTKAMAMEYVRQPIRINAIAPGGMDTNISAEMKMPDDAEFDLIARFSGLRGLVEVADVADQIVLLASPAGRGFHGACITIDAGITAG